MTTCMGKRCCFGLPCMSFVNVYLFVYVISLPCGFEGDVWDLLVLIPGHFISFYISF